jgi:CrcB protein
LRFEEDFYMLELLAVGAGGFCGCCLRYLISKAITGAYPNFPWGTLAANALAGFLIGFIIGAERQTSVLPERMRLFLTVGFLGGLSTFSAFGLETIEMIETKKFFGAGGNIALNVGAGLVMVAAGILSAKFLVKRF